MPSDSPGSAAGVLFDVAYVSDRHPRHTLDLFMPAHPGSAPLVIWIHGGEFRRGSKADHVPKWLLERGFAVASIDYRLSGDAVIPAQVEDAKSAVRWLRAHAAAYGFDGARIGAWGESAGGYLAAMLGATGGTRQFDAGEHLDVSSRVQAVVDFFGPTDFLQMDAHRIAAGLVHDAPDSPESLVVGGPIQERAATVVRANPITYISSAAPPFLIVHGDSDPMVPHHQSELLEVALRHAGVPVTFHTVKGGRHGQFTDSAVTPLVTEFLEAQLKSSERSST